MVQKPIILNDSPENDFDEVQVFQRYKLFNKLKSNWLSYKMMSTQKRVFKRTQNNLESSNYIGVSRNRQMWQVAKMLGDRKHYICSVHENIIAAIVNDIVGI